MVEYLLLNQILDHFMRHSVSEKKNASSNQVNIQFKYSYFQQFYGPFEIHREMTMKITNYFLECTAV
jgi:hypothetical protein